MTPENLAALNEMLNEAIACDRVLCISADSSACHPATAAQIGLINGMLAVIYEPSTQYKMVPIGEPKEPIQWTVPDMPQKWTIQ